VRFGAFGQDDTADVPLKDGAGFDPGEELVDEWACRWETTDVPNMGQVKGHPLDDLRDVDKIPTPDYNDDRRYEAAPQAIQSAAENGKYVTVGIFAVLFERMHMLHGFENVLSGLLLDRPAMEALADKIVETHLVLIDNLRRRFGDRIHGISMTDDWGTQQSAFVSFDLWINFFYPRYKRLFDAMHDAGYDVWVHSCGRINEIIEGYIRTGVDVVNLQQPRAMGIREIGERYRDRIAFESLADIQATLPTGDRRRVDEDVEMLMTHWASSKGGFVFSDYGDPAGIGVNDPEIKLYMYERFSEYSERIYGEPLPPPKIPQAV
jgi:uroporphyrinogen-III decarboxylase